MEQTSLAQLTVPHSAYQSAESFRLQTRTLREKQMVYAGAGRDWDPWLAMQRVRTLQARLVPHNEFAQIVMRDMISLNNWENRATVDNVDPRATFHLEFSPASPPSASAYWAYRTGRLKQLLQQTAFWVSKSIRPPVRAWTAIGKRF